MGNSSQKAIFSMTNAYKSFQNKQILKDVSFEVFPGEVVCLIGPSGSGKTTSIRAAALLERLDSGEIVFREKKLCSNSDNGHSVYVKKKELNKARSRFGFVFQHFNLFPHFTVYENITDAPIHVHNKDKEQVDIDAKNILRNLGLSELSNSYPCELSGGQQQRVAIARTLILNPDIVFLDEPTSALDPKSTNEVLSLIEQMAMKNMTLVVVTHELVFARKVADRIIFMNEGKIAEQGVSLQMIDNPRSKELRKFLRDFEAQI